MSLLSAPLDFPYNPITRCNLCSRILHESRRAPPPRKHTHDEINNLLVHWPPADQHQLAPVADVPSDEGAALAIGSIRLPWGGLATLVVTLYRSYPGVEVDADSIDDRWVLVELY